MKLIRLWLYLLLISRSVIAMENPFSCKLDTPVSSSKTLLPEKISYQGYVFNGSEKFAILKVNETEHILGKNETLQDYQLVAVTTQYIELKREEQVLRIPVIIEEEL